MTGNVLAGSDTICSGQVFSLTYLIFIKQFQTEFQWRPQLTMIRQREQITCLLLTNNNQDFHSFQQASLASPEIVLPSLQSALDYPRVHYIILWVITHPASRTCQVHRSAPAYTTIYPKCTHREVQEPNYYELNTYYGFFMSIF